ncbi:Msx2-interacting protein,Protein split ends [Lepeophtheirus salmonis]|uniref:Msx2-interacting protein,Protein split ends n=1 Tax=Lepeophtheirus salmonis TaxID=72036 RepID=A0A7R8CJW8_LEPSM|nr:Msx2-interacting protein,Protein split ends [Lepeophtheirus salmonis]CAF2815647.1 Msx2-interacting protein,Protein split ends [Lepeophtheirus salmonis]
MKIKLTAVVVEILKMTVLKLKMVLDEIQHKEESIRNIPSGKDFLELKKDNINLVDPEKTGYLHVMKQSDEGKYIPVQIANRPTAINSSSNMIPGVPTVLTPRLFPKVSPSIQIHPVLSPTNNINHSFNPIPHLEANNVKLTGSSSSNVPSSVVSLLPNQPLPLNTDTHCITDKRTLPLPRLPQVPVPFKLPETSDNVHVVSLKPREVELDKKERIAVEALSSIPRYSKPQSKEEFDQIIRHMMSKGHPEHVAMSLASTVLQDRMKSVRQQTSTNDVILTEHVQHRSSLSLPSESFVSNSSCDSPVVLPSDNPKTSLPIPEFTFPNLEDYPVVWQGFLGLKNDSATVQFHYVSGCKDLARSSLPPPPIKDGELQMPLLRIGQRMRLEASQLDGVSRKKMRLPQEHCILLALPCGKDAHDVELQSRQLRNHLITYLQLKSAAGIVNISNDGETQSAYVVHVFSIL